MITYDIRSYLKRKATNEKGERCVLKETNQNLRKEQMKDASPGIKQGSFLHKKGKQNKSLIMLLPWNNSSL